MKEVKKGEHSTGFDGILRCRIETVVKLDVR